MKMQRVLWIVLGIFGCFSTPGICYNKHRDCVEGYEFIIHELKRTYDSANRACTNEGFELAKVDSLTKTELINKHLKNGEAYWIGLKYESGSWRWRDGTSSSRGYQNWLGGAPNNINYRCVFIDSGNNRNWKDFSCSLQYFQFFYICHKRIQFNIKANPSQLTIVEPGQHEISCTSGYLSCTSAPLRWEKNGEFLNDTDLLVLQVTNISVAGTYTCQKTADGAMNSETVDVSVSGSPTQVRLFSVACAANLTIEWKVNLLSIGFPHKVQAYPDLNMSNMTIERWITPHIEDQVLELSNLLPLTNYTVEITACPRSYNCPLMYMNYSTASTNGVPNSVQNVELKIEVPQCSISWTRPGIIGDQIIRYEITLLERIVQYRVPSADNYSVRTSNHVSFAFTPLPNRNYTISLKAISCGGKSAAVNATGFCYRPPKAPNQIMVATESDTRNGTRYLHLEVPSEDNGLISCLIVVISSAASGSIANDDVPFTSNSLQSILNEKEDYFIAVVIPASEFALNSSLEVALSDNKTTSCNLYTTTHIRTDISTNKSEGRGKNEKSVPHNELPTTHIPANINAFTNEEIRVDETIIAHNEVLTTHIPANITTNKDEDRGKNETLIAHNIVLNDNMTYKIQVIAAVPYSGNLSFSTSKYLYIYPSPEATNGPDPIQIATISSGAFLALLLGCVIIIIIIKKRRHKKASVSSKSINPPRETPQAQHGGISNDGLVQENVGGKVEIYMKKGEKSYVNYNVRNLMDVRFTIDDIEKMYSGKRKNENATFCKEFQKIKHGSAKIDESKVVASDEQLKSKNRYRNILPYDATRVILNGTESGYINASFIRGHSQQIKYIAAQGPLTRTVADFWVMVFEQQSSVIVMLTRTHERGKKKCEKYWPNEGKHANFGPINVGNMQETNFGAYVCRQFRLSIESQDENSAEYKFVKQYHFRKWPDHGVPQTTSNLLHMHRSVLQSYVESGATGPIIVHCSAGAGRTGTFIGYDILLNKSSEESELSVFECVMEMRKQRVDMVQNTEQYIFLHKILLESCIFGETEHSSEETRRRMANYSTPEGKEIVKREFENVGRIEPTKSERKILAEDNFYNLRGNDAPYDYSVVTAAEEGEFATPYMNASWVETYDEECPIIAAQGPTDRTIVIFWNSIINNNVSTIVSLTNLAQDGPGRTYQYWPTRPGDQLRFGELCVTWLGTDTGKNVVKRTLTVEKRDKMVKVLQLQLINWSLRSNEAEVSRLVEAMQGNVRDNPESAALIHCSNGLGAVGTFCAIVNLIDRVNAENRVDLFRTVKDIRDTRPDMVVTLEQYAYCLRVVVQHLRSLELYVNF